MLELTLRLVFSLAAVVGLLLLLARLGARRFTGGTDSLVQVVHRQPLSRTSAVAVVTVGSRVLVLGTTEQQVTVLTELDPEELVSETEVTEAMTAEGTVGGPTTPVAPGSPSTATTRLTLASATPLHRGQGALTGSVLSARTWRQAMTVLSSARKTS